MCEVTYDIACKGELEIFSKIEQKLVKWRYLGLLQREVLRFSLLYLFPKKDKLVYFYLWLT